MQRSAPRQSHVRRTAGDSQAARWTPPARLPYAAQAGAGSTGAAASRLAFDFGRIAVRAPAAAAIQAKLTVNAPGDSYEQEADTVAEQVTSAAAPLAPQIRPRAEDERLVPRDALGDAQVRTAPPIVQEVLRSPGQPLDAATRAYMEPRFGHDFGRVRVHADPRAADSARALDARAYTVGRDVVFGAEQYPTGSSQGRKLIAHELAHVVQQGFGAASPAIQRQPATAERAEQRRLAFLKELAKWPNQAHQHWKRLGIAERITVLEQMARRYGRAFAAEFQRDTASPTLEGIDYGPGFPEQTHRWFQARGYRLAQTGAGLDSVLEWWVHPSGRVIMKIRELPKGPPPEPETEPEEPEEPEPVEVEPPKKVVDPPPPDFPTDIPEPIDYSRPRE